MHALKAANSVVFLARAPEHAADAAKGAATRRSIISLNLKNMTRALVIFCLSLLFASCADLTDRRMPKFDDGMKIIRVDVNFEGMAGDITRDEFAQLINSKDVKIRLQYMPSTRIPWLNSDFAWEWGSYLPIPRGWRLDPIFRYVDVNQRQYVVADGRAISFNANKTIAGGYVLKQISIDIPNPDKPLKWKLKPISLEVLLADTLDIEYSSPPLKLYTYSGTTTHHTPFRYDATMFGLVGSVVLDGAYPIVFENVVDENFSELKEDRYVLHPASTYARYEEALLHHRDHGVTDHDEEINEINRLARELIEVRESDRTASESRSRLEKLRVVHARMLAAYSAKMEQSNNWSPIEHVQWNGPDVFEGMEISGKNLVRAKVEGRLLELLQIQLYKDHGLPDRSCIQSTDYTLFFVDKELVSFKSGKHVCPERPFPERMSVAARWDDNGQLGFYQARCDRCSLPMQNNLPSEADINGITRTAAEIKAAFLPR